MSEHEFTLMIEGQLSEEQTARALFKSGCDDATFGVTDGIGYGEFAREASSLAEAVLEAMHQVESVPGLKVLRLEPDDFVTMSDIAERLDRTRESVRLLVSGQRGPGAFPAPASHGMSRNRLWRWSEVGLWLGALEPEQVEAALFVSALNAALELRRDVQQMHDELSVKEVLSIIHS